MELDEGGREGAGDSDSTAVTAAAINSSILEPYEPVTIVATAMCYCVKSLSILGHPAQNGHRVCSPSRPV